VVAVRSKASVCGPSLTGIAGSNPTEARKSVSCEFSAAGRSLVQPTAAACGMSECDRGTQKYDGLGPLGLSNH
jgi:hypothetical protein